MDIDRWKIEDIHTINQICQEQTPIWRCAISHPAFEIWLLMHYQTVDQLPQNPPKSLKQFLHTNIDGGYQLEAALLGVDQTIETGQAIG